MVFASPALPWGRGLRGGYSLGEAAWPGSGHVSLREVLRGVQGGW